LNPTTIPIWSARPCPSDGGKSPGASSVWFAYSSLAVYDAVNAITQQYRPFYYQASAPSTASVDAAAVAAAYRILSNYFPSQQSALDTQYFGSLLHIADNGGAKPRGVAVGEAAAAAVIAARAGDGLEASITYTPGPGLAPGFRLLPPSRPL
jgi:hypothetical protein